jgi:hypothetical protein
MGVTICLPVFGNPGQELEEGATVKGQQLRDLAADLQERLHKAADTLDKLGAAGWTGRVAMYDVILLHEGVQTREEAASRLRELGVDPEELMIIEDVEEDEAQE